MSSQNIWEKGAMMMNKSLEILAKKVRGVSLAGVSLALLLVRPLPVSARTISTSIDTEKSPQGILFMSGGVGREERQQMVKMAQGYDFKLAFADRNGNYLSAVKVSLYDELGREILRTTTAGPWLYVDLPGGKYDLKASFGNRTEEIKDVEISRGRLMSRLLHWDSIA